MGMNESGFLGALCEVFASFAVKDFDRKARKVNAKAAKQGPSRRETALLTPNGMV
jgi:hypothetical protein